jgi:hypothetical protein
MHETKLQFLCMIMPGFKGLCLWLFQKILIMFNIICFGCVCVWVCVYIYNDLMFHEWALLLLSGSQSTEWVFCVCSIILFEIYAS